MLTIVVVHCNILYLMLLKTMESVPKQDVVTSEIRIHTNTGVIHMDKTSVGKHFNWILRLFFANNAEKSHLVVQPKMLNPSIKAPKRCHNSALGSLKTCSKQKTLAMDM